MLGLPEVGWKAMVVTPAVSLPFDYDSFRRLRVPIPTPTKPVPNRSKVVGSGTGVKVR